ncbi:vascular endothelial growth factor receptor 1-like [Copidosoma floridanum]|uniref:vascular endothelial growth factor receptor 1-like n=1 Tax=Copidosoma floridanum TaxID=29053 RepID=UPI000C6F5517|nr:vascular endothelial growth factor receptor 1-like [Copidosoma floridanum]
MQKTNKPCINLTSYDLNKQSEDGKSVSFLAFVDACPIPTLEWIHPQGYRIGPYFMGIRMFNNKSMSRLTKSNINKNDSGIFTLRAKYDGVSNASLGIIEPNRRFKKGDNISLIYAAVTRKFSKVVWYDDSKQVVVNSERIRVTSRTTEFSHQAILLINNVSESDRRNYYCKATKRSYAYYHEKIHTKSYFLAIKVPPYLNYFNTNDTEKTVLARDFENPLILSCDIEGIPTPNITWFKNDIPLKLSPRFGFENSNEKLIIRFLFEKDGGNYLCLAKNDFGTIAKSQIIILKEERQSESGIIQFKEGAPNLINPKLSVDDQSELLPYDERFEFPKENIKLDKQLGSGAFGVVYKAVSYGIFAKKSKTTVAVKTVRKNADPIYITALAKELKIMIYLEQHLNVINLLGACTKNIAKRELLVIVELCRFGNLQSYFLCHRKNFINQIEPNTDKINPSVKKKLKRTKHENSDDFSTTLYHSSPKNKFSIYYTVAQNLSGSTELSDDFDMDDIQPDWRSNYKGDYTDKDFSFLCSEDLLLWAYQVANGMEYLTQRKVLHCDLAARNILLAENNIVKICDFGLAKTLYKDENYKKQCDGKIPIRWMAIESIRDGVFSTMSDVWSFGVVLWEFFTLAEIPYSRMGFEKMYQKLIRGYRLGQPAYATKDIYDIMLHCWEEKPTSRPSFTILVESIRKLLQDNAETHFLRLYHGLMSEQDRRFKYDIFKYAYMTKSS